MVKTWDNFFPYVQPHVPGCPEIVIQTHLQEAAAEYIARSELWRFDIESDFTSKNTSDYEIDVPTGAVLENILTLFVNGAAAKRVTDRHFQVSNTADNSAPSSFSIYQDKPSLSATGVEDFIFETHGRSIACGAIWRLTVIPGKEWSNPELAMYYKTEFYKHMDAAKGRDTRRVNLRIASVGFDRATARGGI
jgi:hypothetical protein